MRKPARVAGGGIEEREMRGYVICGERRSGSNYLCSLLASTGVLGVPTEYFSVEAMIRRGIADYPDDPESQFQMLIKLGTTPNDVYGFKLHAVEFDQSKMIRWVERLPSLAFAYLERRDILGQAISWVRASQTFQWVSYHERQGEPVYHRDRIDLAIQTILTRQKRWQLYFARNGITPIYLVYEHLAQSPQAAVEAIGRVVGLSEKPVVDFSQVRFEIQRDALTDEWRHRYLADSRDYSRFD